MTDRILVTGLMSGSSLDGVDLACCQFLCNEEGWHFEIRATETFSYPSSLYHQLNEAMGRDSEQLVILDHELGVYFGTLLNRFHREHQVSPELVASHGHTIFHEPSRGRTLQIGNGQAMADLTGLRVVNNFRSADVAQGGQGAPLVPVGDRLLFGQYGACLNLGGFANISFEMEQGMRIAYDIGPCNLSLNWIASRLGKPFDPEGTIAQAGTVEGRLLHTLNQLPYYTLPPPKSLGREWFRTNFLPFLSNTHLTFSDLMATTVEHLSFQIGDAINQSGARQVLVTGGGAFNLFLLERLNTYIHARLVVPDPVLIAFKEALVFAFLGVLRIRNEINCLASVTGGKQDLSAGEIYSPT